MRDGTLESTVASEPLREIPGDGGLPLLGYSLAYMRDPHALVRARVARHGEVSWMNAFGKLFITLATRVLKWKEPAEPLRILGPLYFVGTKGLGAFLFTTSVPMIFWRWRCHYIPAPVVPNSPRPPLQRPAWHRCSRRI